MGRNRARGGQSQDAPSTYHDFGGRKADNPDAILAQTRDRSKRAAQEAERRARREISGGLPRASEERFGRSRPGSPRPTGHELAGLTDRERQVLTLVAAGLSNDEIASRLCVSPLTSKTPVSRIMTKLDARARAQLVVLAYECGLVVPGQRAAMP